MNSSLFALLAINYAYIGILPRIFFRKDGRYNLMWWLTSSPLFLSGLYVFALYFFGGHEALQPLAVIPYGDMIAVALSALSIGMISMTLGTHRVPLALWHQHNDAPVNIVTWGSYKHVRHPFYSSFIIAQIGTLIALPHALTLIGALGTLTILTITARKEEKKLSQSQFGAEYQAYMKKAGRFFPKIGA